MKPKILFINNEKVSNELLSVCFKKSGYEIVTTTDSVKGLELFNNDEFHLIISNLNMPEISGLKIIKHIKENRKDMEIIILSDDSTVETAVKVMKAGATEYLIKPVTGEKLLSAVDRACGRLRNRNKNVTAEYSRQYGIIGESEKIRNIYKLISKASRTKATVLITGESGTGKELVARAIHYTGQNSKESFIPVNCGGIPETLLESELFGYVKGSFTGALETRQGFFQIANGGTIFLDEISEMSSAMQVKLLRVLQEKEIFMIGGRKPVVVNIKIIAASNKNLKILVENGLFREDLFYRLNVITIHLPPLREREDDILLLINYFFEKYSKEFEKPVPEISEYAFNALRKYRWPGNIRELENTIQMLVAMNEDEEIDAPDLPEYMRFSALKGIPLTKTLEEVELEYMQRVLLSVEGNRSKAAKILGIDRKTLWDRLKKKEKDR